MKIGLYHPPVKVVRRIVSEDSTMIVSQFTLSIDVLLTTYCNQNGLSC